MLIVFFRAIILYIIIVFSIRLMGKRQLGELQPSELVVTILISNIATLPIEDVDLPMLMGIVPILTIVCLDVFMSAASLKFHTVRRLVSGTPKIVIRNGKVDQKALRDLRFSVDDLMESIRSYNIFDIREVQFAIVETTGIISVYQKFKHQNVTAEMLEIKGESINPPQIIIDDGRLINEALTEIKMGKGWLNGLLLDKDITIDKVFLMTADESGSFHIVKKEECK